MTASHPIRVRGLKLDPKGAYRIDDQSHPIRVRGLKQCNNSSALFQIGVAPYTGAWIETVAEPEAVALNESHPIRVRGLKQD